jgi:hypothetical protein
MNMVVHEPTIKKTTNPKFLMFHLNILTKAKYLQV